MVEEIPDSGGMLHAYVTVSLSVLPRLLHISVGIRRICKINHYNNSLDWADTSVV